MSSVSASRGSTATTSTGRAAADRGGAAVLVRAAADGSTADLTPPPFNVRTRVHEYGGGSFVVVGGAVVFSNFADNRLYRIDPGAVAPVPMTPEGPWRYADLRPDLERRRFVAVREDHQGGGEPVNTIVTIPLEAGTRASSSRDPTSCRRRASRRTGRCSPGSNGTTRTCRGTRPRLHVAAFAPDGTLGEASLAAGGPDESIVQPEWSPDGTLHLISDRTGWWNLYRIVEGPRLEPIATTEAEFADPAWIFGRSTYGFLDDGAIVAIARRAGRDHLYLDRAGSSARRAGHPVHRARRAARHVARRRRRGGQSRRPVGHRAVRPADPRAGGVLRRASTIAIDPAAISMPESIEFPTTGDRTAFALYYPPTNPAFVGTRGREAAARRA